MIVVENVDSSRNISMTHKGIPRNARSSVASEAILMVPTNELERSNTELGGNISPFGQGNYLDDI